MKNIFRVLLLVTCTLLLAPFATAQVASRGPLFHTRTAKSGAFTVGAADREALFHATTGTWSVSLTSAATLGGGFSFSVFNSGGGVITLDPAGSQTIRDAAGSATTKTLAQGESAIVTSDGTGWLMFKWTAGGASSWAGLTGTPTTLVGYGITDAQPLNTNLSIWATKAVTASEAELNYLAGVTSGLQAQLNGKEPSITAGTAGQYWRGDKSFQTLNATAVGLGSVTNDAQTKAAIVPNTAPSSGQILVGNAGGTAYAPVTMSGKVTMTNAGVTSVTLASGDIPNNAANTSGTAAGLSGTPALPNGTTASTQTVDDATLKVATDAFVLNQAAAATPAAVGTAAVGTSTRYARADHVHAIADAAADGATKGRAAFNANDFNDAAGIISLDYTGGQTSSDTVPGFMSAADHVLLGGKLAASGGTATGATLAGATSITGTVNYPAGSFDTITITANAGSIDVTKGFGSATNNAATTLTLSADNTTATRFITRILVNSDASNARTFTIDTVTDIPVTVAASSSVTVILKSQGASGWALSGGGSSVLDLSANTTPASTQYYESISPVTGVSTKVTGAHLTTVNITADALADDSYGNGSVLIFGKNAGATIAQWDLVYLNSSGVWVLCDADAGTPLGITGMIGLAITSGTNGNPLTVLQKGFIRNDGWAWTAGSRLYASGTAGGMTHTPPSTATNAIMVVGAAITDDEIWFDGSLIWAIKG